ncbi:MAG: aldehyde dehydrogenase [Candidatus Aenigmarchaeota archaeon]|nr:aldehyde dehydrogenase [Candidatus Aenigmarchaeota archaeon]
MTSSQSSSISPIANYIGGRLVHSNSTFDVRSPFYSDYSISLQKASPEDVDRAFSYGRRYSRTKKPDPEALFGVLRAAGDGYSPSEQEVEYAVKMTGIPAKVVKANLRAIQEFMWHFGDIMKQRYDVDEHGFCRDLGNGSVEVRVPKGGSTVAYLPYGDLFPPVFVATQTLAAERATLIRPSSSLAYFSVKLGNVITDAARRNNVDLDGAVNVLTWDSRDPSQHTNVDLINQRTHPIDRLGFGSSENLKALGVGIVYDHGSCKAIVDQGCDTRSAARSVAAGALENPLACDTTRMVWVHAGVRKEFEYYLKKEFEARKLGDPLQGDTDIGFVDFNDLTRTLNVIDHGVKQGSEELLYPETGNPYLVRVGEYQAQPMILRAHNMESPLMSGDYNLYMVMLREVQSFDTAVREIGSSQLPSPLCVSYYGDGKNDRNRAFELATSLPSAHVNIGTNTRYHNLALPHQGIYPFEEWTTPVSISITVRQ